jgi:glycerol-3-phosphate acyltransferase PlsY
MLVVLIFSYLIGSIPFGWLLTKFAGLGDIRSIGSGNIGATNVLRTGNKKLAALTLILDFAKGAAAVLLAKYIYPELASLAAFAVLIGHMFPVWLKFKGGKGVAPAAGALTALAWPVGIVVSGIWLLVLWRSRLSSLAALMAAVAAPLAALLFGHGIFWPVMVLAILVIAKHRANIQRLISGTEPKIGTHNNESPA